MIVITNNEDVFSLRCNHYFHRECLIMMINEKTGNYPKKAITNHICKYCPESENAHVPQTLLTKLFGKDIANNEKLDEIVWMYTHTYKCSMEGNNHEI